MRRLIEGKLIAFIDENLLDEPDGADPLASELIDSVGLLRIARYAEKEFGIRIDEEEMARRNFANVPALAAFIDSKRPGEAR